MIGIDHTFLGVAELKVAVPTFRSAGLHVPVNAIVAAVVVGIVAGLSIHGTLAVAAGFAVEVTCNFVAGCSEALAEPQDDKIAADIKKASGRAVGFLPMSVEV